MELFSNFEWWKPKRPSSIITESSNAYNLSASASGRKIANIARYKSNSERQQRYNPVKDCPGIHFQILTADINHEYIYTFYKNYGLLMRDHFVKDHHLKWKNNYHPAFIVDNLDNVMSELQKIKSATWVLNQLKTTKTFYPSKTLQNNQTAYNKLLKKLWRGETLTSDIHERIFWGNDQVYLFISNNKEWRANYHDLDVDKGDIEALLQRYICDEVADQFFRHTSVKIEAKNHRLQLLPKNLLGSIWAMIWNDFVGKDLMIIRCKHCKKNFDYRRKPGPAPKHCSNACKQAAYRKRISD